MRNKTGRGGRLRVADHQHPQPPQRAHHDDPVLQGDPLATQPDLPDPLGPVPAGGGGGGAGPARRRRRLGDAPPAPLQSTPPAPAEDVLASSAAWRTPPSPPRPLTPATPAHHRLARFGPLVRGGRSRCRRSPWTWHGACFASPDHVTVEDTAGSPTSPDLAPGIASMGVVHTIRLGTAVCVRDPFLRPILLLL